MWFRTKTYYCCFMQNLRDSKILDYLFSLPDNPEESDIEADDDDLEQVFSSHDYLSTPSTPLETWTHNYKEQIVNNDVQLDSLIDGNISVASESGVNFEQDDETGEFTDSHWDDDVTDFEELNLPSVLDPKPTVNFALADNELVYFEKLFDDLMIQHICFQTNLYCKQKNSAQWRELTVQELKAFLGIIIVMGIHQLPEAASYWSSDPYLNVNAVSNIMTLAHYKKIIENLHCNDNLFQLATNDPGYDKLYKIRPLISAQNKNCLKVYHPSTSLAVDESMVAFK
ncbi:piggyBac transposable element-derived protein 4-like [Schistocerca americana]|uniref:piggyBac transposable element-derived protein 4-like n=1 Tax=Schistocerca americana TaxID=7009 RepID=UPI001F4F3E91|nr:piggyBac transposable element-derived protein 4-like [Schistocerca americana]